MKVVALVRNNCSLWRLESVLMVRSGEVGEDVPEGDAGADGDVEGVLGAELGDFEADLAGVDNVGIDAVNFMPGDDGVFFKG